MQKKSRYKIYHDSIKARGLCHYCLKPNDRPGRYVCSKCQIPYREKQKKAERARLLRCKEKGICSGCGNKNDTPQYYRCTACRAKQSKQLMNRYYSRKKNNRCGYCGSGLSSSRKICDACKKKQSNLKKLDWRRKKELILNACGNICACCGESNEKFLTLDHVNNDGYKHRAIVGNAVFQDVIRRGFPSEFQILCYNCNYGKSHNDGVCPHKDILN